MGSLAPIVIMSINYSHDIATAMLAVSALAMWIISRGMPVVPSIATEQYFLRLYGSITRMAKDSLIYILVAGVPRIYFYTDYEWATACGELQIVAIIIKHIVMFLLVGIGLYFWRRLGLQVRTITLKHTG